MLLKKFNMNKTILKYFFNLLFILTLNLSVSSQENHNKSKPIELDEVEVTAFSKDNIDRLKYIDLGKVKDFNEDYTSFEPLKSDLKDVEIVMLGEQSHGEGTTYDTKIKLIKYLHQEMGFDLLVFESGLYDCNKAWENIKKGNDVAISLGNSVQALWSTTKQFNPLVKYIDQNKHKENPLIVSGFDNQLAGEISRKEFVSDLKNYLNQKDEDIIVSKKWKKLETSLQYLLEGELNKYKKRQAVIDTTFINTIITKTESNDSLSKYWSLVLKSTKYYISDTKLKTNFRDRQMAENLIWIKEQNPNKKIICWGATSHFLYNSSETKFIAPYNIYNNEYRKYPMMGQYLKEKYKSKIFTIGFIAYKGNFGLWGNHKIKTAKKNSLEYLIEKSGLENCFLNLKQANFENIISRPLANLYMKNNISNVMDGVIFNKNMERPILDYKLFKQIFPENIWVKPQPETK